MDSLLLQKQIQDNSEDLRTYLQDLKSWESEMKRKEGEINSAGSDSQSHPPVRSKVKNLPEGEKKSKIEVEKLSKISGLDYASWDKFDVEKACEEVDNEEQEDTKENDDFISKIVEERRIEEAVYEKERGNNFVKKQKWKEAIQCYSLAVKYYPHDPIFYANRALCYLKIQDLKSAETDCTTALQLDPQYVKAYQRRAMARAGLGQLLEAKADLLKVMELEPKNMASKAELTKIEKKINANSDKKSIDKQSESVTPKNIAFKLKSNKELHCRTENPLDEKASKKSLGENIGEIKKGCSCTSSNKEVSEAKLETSSSTSNKIIEQKLDVTRLSDNEMVLWPSDNAVKLVKPIQKAPHLHSKKSLKRVTIQEVDNSTLIEDEAVNKLSATSSVMKDTGIENNSDEAKSLIVTSIELPSRKETSVLQNTVNKDTSQSNIEDNSTQVPPVPSTSVEFYVGWKKINSDPQLKYLYLKQIPGLELACLFGDSLESSIFSDIISIFETYFIEFKEHLLPYMIGLTKVRRFGALVMFLSQADKAGVKKILHYCKTQGECSHEEFTDLLKKYEL